MTNRQEQKISDVSRCLQAAARLPTSTVPSLAPSAGRGLLIAFSGGQDSALLAKLARDTLGDDALAVTVVSAFLADSERRRARQVAADIGIAHDEMDMDVLGDPIVAANPKDRCYHCKRRIFEALGQRARERCLAGVCDGANLDDETDYRPGRRATAELGVLSPLAAAGFAKSDIREVSRELGMRTWDLPSSACLASRIPYETKLEAEVLKRVEDSEELLHGIGIRQCRVRVHGDMARIEVEPADLARVMEHREALVTELTQAGFQRVALDLQGFRSGSLNEGVVEAAPGEGRR